MDISDDVTEFGLEFIEFYFIIHVKIKWKLIIYKIIRFYIIDFFYIFYVVSG